jgi:hypothetical protein
MTLLCYVICSSLDPVEEANILLHYYKFIQVKIMNWNRSQCCIIDLYHLSV